MIYYHGTTRSRAKLIGVEGFKPLRPSRRVWFTRSKPYAARRARTQARRSRDGSVVLTCDLDLQSLARRGKVHGRSSTIAIAGTVPATALRSHGADGVTPVSPDELHRWICRLLHIKLWNGPGRDHPGIDRLSRWVSDRRKTEPDRPVREGELIELAQRWLPQFFTSADLNPNTLACPPRCESAPDVPDAPDLPVDPREEEALACLTSLRPSDRIRSLTLLAQIEDPDLFDWCVMFLEDDANEARVAALQTIKDHCEDADTAVLEPFVVAENIHIRAAAIAALCRHGGADAARWFERGLKDPSPHVRLQVTALLDRLDPMSHHRVFELALVDPNPQVAQRAGQLTAHKHYAPMRW